MSNCKSYSYPGFGTWARANLHYAQAVRVGDRIHCSGQGGWDPDQEEIDIENLFPPTLAAQIDQAFSNCDHNLKHAGGKGFSQVYKIVTYSTDLQGQHEHIVRNLNKWFPDHVPIWTELGVKELGAPGMYFEIDVEAYDPEGAKAEKEKA